MTLNLDTSSPIRSHARYREFAGAVFEASSSAQETLAIEWKSQADVGDKAWQAELSRQVLGFANREPEVAATWFEGCAYILVGVSPGILNGTPVHDSAKIDAWLSTYIGSSPNAPEWAPAYVDIDGKDVLILTVEAPRPGNRIWTCRKTYSGEARPAQPNQKVLSLREGAIYVRHKASTMEATSQDIEMLERRSQGNRRRITNISLTRDASTKACPIDRSDQTIEAWASLEREGLEPPPIVPVTEQDAGLLANSPLLAVARWATEVNNMFWEPDPRTPEQYQSELDEYIELTTKMLPFFLLRRACEHKLGRVSLTVSNGSDDPISQLQVELVIAEKGVLGVSDYDAELFDVELPTRPAVLGKARRSTFGGLTMAGLVPDHTRNLARSFRPIGRGLTIDNSRSCRITFDPIDFYAQQTVRLEDFYLFADGVEFAGKTLTAEWTARAKDLSGVHRGSVQIEVDGTVPTIDELLAEQKIEDDHGD